MTKSVLILGGGPAGLATAIALAKQHVHVRIVESQDYEHYRAGEHLPPDGVMALLNLTSPVNWRQTYTACFGVQSSWGSEELKQVDYIKHPISYGLNLSRPHFDNKLAEYAQQQGVEIYTHCVCLAANYQDEQWRLKMKRHEEEEIWDADFVVDATGRKAAFARLQHKYPVHFDKLVAIAVGLTAKDELSDEKQTLLVETVENGWWYFIALQDPDSKQQRALAVFMTDEDLMQQTKKRSWNTWKSALAQSIHVRERVKQYSQADNLRGFQVASQMLPCPRGSAWMAVGDAAIAFDPLSSQGMSKAFMAAESHADIISEYLAGNLRALDHYGNQVRQELMQYMELRSGYYKTEQRWGESEFWRRRQEIQETVVQANRSFDRIKEKFKFRRKKPKVEAEKTVEQIEDKSEI